MKRDELNTEFYSELHISDEMMESLVADVKKGRRHADIRFRYSTALLAGVIIAGVGFGGLGVSAAYQSYKNRIQEMPEEEQIVYEQELEADTYAAAEEGRTRGFSNAEYQRYLELEDAYYRNGLFPEENIKHVKGLDEITANDLAFVEEINKIHMPEGEMTDEQMLQLIDHQAKYYYTIKQTAEAEGYAEEQEQVQETEAPDLKTQCLALIKAIYGAEPDESWNYSAYENLPTGDFDMEEEFMREFAGYSVTFSESDAPNATFYQVIMPLYDGGAFVIGCGGKDYYNDTTEYTRAEAEVFVEEGQEAVLQFVHDKFGLGTPDRIEIGGFVNAADEEITSQDISYYLYYGEEEVSVSWNIIHKMVYSVCGHDLQKTAVY